MNKNIFYFTISLLCTCLFFSCENEESIIGENLLMNNQHDVFILGDSLIEIASFSNIEDSLNAQNSTNLLGSYFDPISGQTNASFCFQITLPNNEMSFDAINISSIELRFPLNEFFGDSTTNFNIKLSTLNQSINLESDSEYFTTDNFESTLIEGAEYLINISEILDSNALILQIPTTFGLNEILNLPSEALANSESFTEVFYGFKLEVQPIIDNGSIIYLNSSSDDAFLQIEYINSNNDDGIVTNFPVNSGVRLNHVNHEYDQLLLSDTTLLFLQSMGGVFSELDFSFLENYQDSGYIVNEATLELSVFEENENFKIPQQLSLYEYYNNNLISIEGLSGGVLSSDNSYEFDITRHIQKILLENHNPICRLHTYQRSSNADRVILNKTIKLTLIFIEG